MWKRISAALLDFILLITVIMGMALLMSALLGYDGYMDRMNAKYDEYEAQYGLSFDITSEEYNALPPEEKAVFDEANEAFGKDEEAIYLQNVLFNNALIIVIFSVLLAYLVLEFLVPLFLKNGQTVGKKIFGIGVMRVDGVRVTPVLMFARSVLGKCTVETLVPVLIVIMILFGIMGFFGTMVILALGLFQIILVAATRARTPIHDLLAQTVTVDFASQMIFDTPEDLLAYKTRIHAEEVEKKKD
ncbi:MAG: RDD family protein [Clostridia bacterium]|nr:RDD family protein [Clostridia bacterium]